jgi:hypothetical protein
MLQIRRRSRCIQAVIIITSARRSISASVGLLFVLDPVTVGERWPEEIGALPKLSEGMRSMHGLQIMQTQLGILPACPHNAWPHVAGLHKSCPHKYCPH